jgi:hypothetical protein
MVCSYPRGVRAEPEVLGLGLTLGLGLGPQDSEGGRGLVRAAWLPPGWYCISLNVYGRCCYRRSSSGLVPFCGRDRG